MAPVANVQAAIMPLLAQLYGDAAQRTLAAPAFGDVASFLAQPKDARLAAAKGAASVLAQLVAQERRQPAGTQRYSAVWEQIRGHFAKSDGHTERELLATMDALLRADARGRAGSPSSSRGSPAPERSGTPQPALQPQAGPGTPGTPGTPALDPDNPPVDSTPIEPEPKDVPAKIAAPQAAQSPSLRASSPQPRPPTLQPSNPTTYPSSTSPPAPRPPRPPRNADRPARPPRSSQIRPPSHPSPSAPAPRGAPRPRGGAPFFRRIFPPPASSSRTRTPSPPRTRDPRPYLAVPPPDQQAAAFGSRPTPLELALDRPMRPGSLGEAYWALAPEGRPFEGQGGTVEDWESGMLVGTEAERNWDGGGGRARVQVGFEI